MRLIDADALYNRRVDQREEMWKDGCDYLVVRWTNITNAPTIDAVPVVRCGECKHYTLGPFGKGCMVHFNHKTDIFTHTPDDYCSYGEKKEDK